MDSMPDDTNHHQYLDANPKHGLRTQAETAQLSVQARIRAAEHRRAQVLVLHRAGMGKAKIAARLGVSLRTVQRDLEDSTYDDIRVEEIIRDECVDAGEIALKLTDMLDADIADIMESDGTIKPPHQWPEVWRKGLVAGLEIEDLSERSHDGETANKDGGWDKVGKRYKVKVLDRAKIIELAGRLKSVAAFENPRSDVNVQVNLHAEIDRRISEGRERAHRAQLENTIDVTPQDVDESK